MNQTLDKDCTHITIRRPAACEDHDVIMSFFTLPQVFVCSDPEDYEKEFKESEMSTLIDEYANSILLNISLPPPPRKKTNTAATGVPSFLPYYLIHALRVCGALLSPLN